MNGVTFEWVVVELLASLIPVSVVQLSELLTSLINIIMTEVCTCHHLTPTNQYVNSSDKELRLY